MKSRLKPGTRYSHLEVVGEGNRRWNHARLPRIPVSAGLSDSEFVDELDIARREAFAAVPMSIAVAPPARAAAVTIKDTMPPATSAKVVSIDSGRAILASKKSSKHAQVIEFKYLKAA